MALKKFYLKENLRKTVITLFSFSIMFSGIGASASTASRIRIVVNDVVITNKDISRRIALLKLLRKSGNLTKMAEDDLIKEVLKKQEISRLHMSVSDNIIDNAFENLAANNKLPKEKFAEILKHAGVGEKHYKESLAIQIAWPRVVNAYSGMNDQMSTEDFIAHIREKKKKPVTTEYILQRIIFIVPQSGSQSKRDALMRRRQKEAEASRSKFPGCNKSKEFAAKMRDVSIDASQRLLTPELQPQFKSLLERAKNGTAHAYITERGAEYIAICNKRQVNDDTAAEIIFKADELNKNTEKNSEKYIAELRSKARILHY